MIRDQQLTPEEVVQSFQHTFPKDISNTRIERHITGVKKTELQHIWMQVSRNAFMEVLKHLFTFDEHPHFVVISGYDIDNTIDLVYHFSLYHGFRNKEQSINMTVSLPKSDPTIDTITDLFPGALISEQEKQEMLGVKVNNIPVDARVFISEDFPKDIYPWRRDETGPEKYIKNLHKVEQ
ncbi:MAG: NADH-quinone oxidoreductase subunit C [Candidatus Thermoplasmatota archaeon]|nr:NADH-quinone oxidoreductase subunit C [Candidatus Thermoplasmatota archaeon]